MPFMTLVLIEGFARPLRKVKMVTVCSGVFIAGFVAWYILYVFTDQTYPDKAFTYVVQKNVKKVCKYIASEGNQVKMPHRAGI